MRLLISEENNEDSKVVSEDVIENSDKASEKHVEPKAEEQTQLNEDLKDQPTAV